ncbi:MAG: hypothetical protein KAW12_16460, partial [Candidatus Aminicenantes bacterium]|nr:hypothetical protein [Candidatus Aminicenantes bacterium]
MHIFRFFAQNLEISKGRVKIIEVENENFKNLLYNLFSGELKGLKLINNNSTIVVNGEDLSAGGKKLDFVYIPAPGVLPKDIKVLHFIKFVAALVGLPVEKIKAMLEQQNINKFLDKRLKELDNHGRGEILSALSPLKKAPLYF